MLSKLKRISKFPKDAFTRGQSLLILSRDIFWAGYQVYKDRNKDKSVEAESVKAPRIVPTDAAKEKLRKNLEKNFAVPDPLNTEELARQTSLKSHQVMEHDPGERLNSNMWQRNYDNHQGN